MATYTHNLKIILVNNNNDNEIKNALCKLNTIDIQWNNTNLKKN